MKTIEEEEDDENEREGWCRVGILNTISLCVIEWGFEHSRPIAPKRDSQWSEIHFEGWVGFRLTTS